MAGKGYIGKISAIVTVNTADAQRAFNKSAADAERYGKSIESTINQATKNAGKSFDNIFTPFQKLQRAIQAAKSQEFNLGIKGLSAEQLRSIEQLSLAAKQLADPLAAAGKQFDTLSFAVQRQFSPALARVQGDLIAIRDRIQEGGTVGREEFGRLAREIDGVTASASRLSETAALTKRLLTLQDSQGLAFARPEVFDGINRLVEAQRGLSSLPASSRGSSAVRQVIEDAQAAQAQVSRISARIERLQSQGLDIRVSRAGLDAALRRLDEVRQRTEEINQSANLGASTDVRERLTRANAIRQATEEEAAFRSRAADQAEREARALEQLTRSQNRLLQAEIDRRSGASARRNAASFDAATDDLLRTPQRNADVLIGRRQRTVESVRAEIRQLDQEFQRLPASAQAALQGDAERLNSIADAAQRGSAGIGTLIAEYEKLAAAVRSAASEEDRRQASLRNASASLTVLQEESDQLSRRGAFGGPQGPPLPPAFGGRSDAGLGSALTDPLRQLELLRSGITSVKGQIDQLPAGLRQQFIPAIAAAEAEFRRLAAAPGQSAAAIDVARQRLLALTRDAGRASEALDFRRSFGSTGAVIGSLQTQQLRGYTAQIQILQGELASVTGLARGPAVAAITRLGLVISEQMRRGTLDTRASRLEVQRFTQDAVRATAAARGINAGALGRTVARAGDVGRQGFANLSLGIQQAAFAFEDFFSVTGGLDQRIRAAGNNISQLGFILGGTQGLIAGISVAIGAQLVAAIIKWTGVTENAERRQRELKDSLEATNGALERQRQLTDQLRKSYADLAKSIAEAGAPEPFRNDRQRREQIDAVRREQEDRRRAGIEAVSPQIAQQRGRIAEIDRRLETEQNAAARQRLIERRNAADAAIRQEINDIERRAAQNAGAAVRDAGNIGRAIEAQQQARTRVREDIDAAARRGTPRGDAEVNRLSRELAVIETTILRLRDAAVRIGAEDGQVAIAGANRAQARLEGVPGIRQLDLIDTLLREELERFQAGLGEAGVTINKFNNAAAIIESAAERVRAFSDALNDAAGAIARTVEQELRGRADTQRRDANAAEAQFGTNNPRAQLARQQQQQSEEAARRATRERERIDAEISRRRQNFENQAIAGEGSPESVRIGARLREIGQALARPPQTRDEANQQERMRLEADVLRRQLQEQFRNTPEARQLARQADLADIRGQQFQQNQDAVRRGFEASISPAQQAGEELGRVLSDLKAALNAGVITLDQYNEAVRRETDERVRATAPAIVALGEQVQNAAMQGPSRAALNSADVSTAEGSRELNRLLRGDDQALQQANLVELQKQSELLKQMLVAAKEQAKPKVVDL